MLISKYIYKYKFEKIKSLLDKWGKDGHLKEYYLSVMKKYKLNWPNY